MPFSAQALSREDARIFRITHVDNLPWLLENGLHCPASRKSDPNHVNIGNLDLIQKRTTRTVPVAPGGILSDYVPWYFTPFSPMLYNIKTGRGVPRRSMSEIAILHTTLPRLRDMSIPFVFADRHAYLAMAKFSSSLADLDRIQWKLLRARDFARDPENPEKMDMYQAEALVHRHLPCHALEGIACYTRSISDQVQGLVDNAGLDIRVTCSPSMYL